MGGPEAKLAELHRLQMTSALCQAALVMYKFIVGLQIPSQILLGLQHNAERRHRAQRSPVAAPKQTHKGRRGRRSSEQKKNATRVLTVNNDLCLLALPAANAGDVAAVEASVGDIDPVDGQDAHGLCGLRQSFPMGLYVDQAVCLAGGKGNVFQKFRFFIH